MRRRHQTTEEIQRETQTKMLINKLRRKCKEKDNKVDSMKNTLNVMKSKLNKR